MKHDKFCMSVEDHRLICCCHEIAAAREESWKDGYARAVKDMENIEHENFINNSINYWYGWDDSVQ